MKDKTLKTILRDKIKKYYESIGRQEIPPIEQYSLKELKKCIILFEL